MAISVDEELQQEQDRREKLEIAKQQDRLFEKPKSEESTSEEQTSSIPQEEEGPFALPNLIGSSQSSAMADLESMSLKGFAYDFPTENRFLNGRVLATKPFPNAEVVPGQRIIIMIGRWQEDKEEKDKENENEKSQEESGQEQTESEVGAEKGLENSETGLAETLKDAEAAAEEAELGAVAAGEGAAAAAGATAVAEGAAVAAEGAVATEGVAVVAVSSFPIWGPVVAILAIIALVVGLGIFVFITMVSYCNGSGVTGTVARAGSTVASYLNVGVDVCAQLAVSATPPPATTTSPTTPPTTGNDSGNRLLLAQYGITVNKADCTSPTQTTCTSLDATKTIVLQEIIKLTQACDISLGGDGTTNKCGIQITGGSEAGHVDNPTCSHADGDKVDVSASAAFTNYIQHNLTPVGARGGAGGGSQFSDPSVISSFVLESAPAHWDISVGCIG